MQDLKEDELARYWNSQWGSGTIREVMVGGEVCSKLNCSRHDDLRLTSAGPLKLESCGFRHWLIKIREKRGSQLLKWLMNQLHTFIGSASSSPESTNSGASLLPFWRTFFGALLAPTNFTPTCSSLSLKTAHFQVYRSPTLPSYQ